MFSIVTRWLLCWLLATIKHSQELVLNMMLVGHPRFCQFMEWYNLGITILKLAIYCPNVFLKIAGKPNNYQFHLPSFLKFCNNISHKLLRL